MRQCWEFAKLVIAYMVVVITSYAMIDGLLHPDDMAFGRNPGSNVDLQPDSLYLQIGSFAGALCIHFFAMAYLYLKNFTLTDKP